jgi:hypothetical protein
MIIEEALFAHLTSDSDVSALVGTRVYPLVAPQDAELPLLVYQRISTPRVRSQSGPSGLAHPRFQITARATSVSQLRDLANKVRIALDGFKGVMGGASGVNVGAIFQDNERDGYGETTMEYSVQMDFIIWHREAIA